MLHWLNVSAHLVNLVGKFDTAKGLLQVNMLDATPGHLDSDYA